MERGARRVTTASALPTLAQAARRLATIADHLAEAVLPPWAYRPLYRRYVLAVGEPELRLLPQLCARDGIAVDVGASLGYYTAWLDRLCGRCIAFEPIRRMPRGCDVSIRASRYGRWRFHLRAAKRCSASRFMRWDLN